MKKIGIDFDDVIYGFNRQYCVFHNEKYGTNKRFEDVVTYDLDKIWGISPEECVVRVNEFYDSKYHGEAEPVPGSVDAVRRLAIDHELHLITSRRDGVKPQTISWLEKHFPNVFTGLHFTNQFGGIGNKKLKSEVCREIGASLMIEDALKYANEVASAGIPVLLLEVPWNRGETKPLVTRVHSWKDVVDHV